jgi:TldD protein
MINGLVEKAQAGIDYGAGIRIFDGFNALYAYTNDTSRENLIKTALAEALGREGKARVLPLIKCEFESIHPCRVLPGELRKSGIAESLREAHTAAAGQSNLMKNLGASYTDSVQDVLIANSEGLWVEDRRVRTRVGFEAYASSETEKQGAFVGPGRLLGPEFLAAIDFSALGKKTAAIALTMLKAPFAPGGVTAVDDGTMPNEWGSINIDDEGSPARRNVLIEKGVLKTFFTPGTDTPASLIADTEYGLYAKRMVGGANHPGGKFLCPPQRHTGGGKGPGI